MLTARSQNQTLPAWIAALPVLFLSSSELTADVAKATRQGRLRKVGPRLYTTDLATPTEALLRSRALEVASLRCPGCVLSHRTALEMKAIDGVVFLTGPEDRTERLSGLTLKIKQGPEPQPDDIEFLMLHRASLARAALECLAYTRHSADVSRGLSRTQVEVHVKEHLRLRGEAGLILLRDRARELAPILHASEGFVVLDSIVDGLLRTLELARRTGPAHDVGRVELFERLRAELHANWRTTTRPRGPLIRSETQNLAFIDAYFSNFIEGTKFEIGEAQGIVFDGHIPSTRPADAHDIQDTFEVLVDDSEMLVSATEFDELEDLEHVICRRHARIMHARADTRPGQFKQVGNQAGATIFVAPELVRGTLERAFALFHQLDTPFQRAAFMMFMIAEIHPFDDGNGRLGRVMMNAELASAYENRILIATSYRIDYLGGLRRLSRDRDPSVFLRMLDHAHEFTARLAFGDLDDLLATLTTCNAFDDSELRRLRLPPLAAS